MNDVIKILAIIGTGTMLYWILKLGIWLGEWSVRLPRLIKKIEDL